MRPEISQLFLQNSPCDDCQHFENCKENELACRAFLAFVVRGVKPKEHTARIPSVAIYNRIFNEEDERALLSYLRSVTAKQQQDLF